MGHGNISIFVPHLGCPNQCSFCNQRYITCADTAPSPEDVISAVNTARSHSGYNSESTEIAFFGGSFTAIDRTYMISLLEAASQFVASGYVKGIRISTRPDCVDDEILELLKTYHVKAIELGAQSMCDSVLQLNKRGHCADDVRKASLLIKRYGFELGLQMMTGLYGSNDKLDIATAEMIAEIKPDTVRIYPTITLRSTDLCDYFEKGRYLPPSLEESVALCVQIEDIFDRYNVKVIRVGLHEIDMNAFVAGPWHPAFHELCQSYRLRIKLEKYIHSAGQYNVFVNPSDLSKFIGQKKSNIIYFSEKQIYLKFSPSANIAEGNFVIKEVN